MIDDNDDPIDEALRAIFTPGPAELRMMLDKVELDIAILSNRSVQALLAEGDPLGAWGQSVETALAWAETLRQVPRALDTTLTMFVQFARPRRPR